MMLIKILLSLFSFCYGLLSAAGVFTVLIAIGLVPRFAGQTHTASKVFWYEEAVVFGTISGCIVSVFEEYCHFSDSLRRIFPALQGMWEVGGDILQGIFGLFCGMFIGCLALAIAEILDSIPIFARRISFRHGIGLAVLSMAAGKVAASLLYFYFGSDF